MGGGQVVNEDGFIFIEPEHKADAPIIDDITRKATALFRACTEGAARYKGFHICTGCGFAMSDNADHFLPDGRPTTSLLVHYVARHRDECPAGDLEWLAGLSVMSEPAEKEIQ